ncbi:hypothetical protein PAMC26577_21345 [Caballeronia sordidicola]|uniref:Uncharacterized protein n=1 Tax=Caballeronia sordidicola TaxID=196367 RepID=A0A242MLU7_CABSO|nr:hypothetical protein PAMC26577_21345 [Caballeronia sordidicola]
MSSKAAARQRAPLFFVQRWRRAPGVVRLKPFAVDLQSLLHQPQGFKN